MPYTPPESEMRFLFSASDSLAPPPSEARPALEAPAEYLLRNPNVSLTPVFKQRIRSLINDAERAFERSSSDERDQRCIVYMEAVYFGFLKEYASTTASVAALRDAEVWIYGHLLNHVFETKWERVRWDLLEEWSAYTQQMADAMRRSSHWPLYIQSLDRKHRESSNDSPPIQTNDAQPDSKSTAIPEELSRRLTLALTNFWNKLTGNLGNKSSLVVEVFVSEIVRYIEEHFRLAETSINKNVDLDQVNTLLIAEIIDKLQAFLAYKDVLGPDLIRWPVNESVLSKPEQMLRSSWKLVCAEVQERSNLTPVFQVEILSCLRSQLRVERLKSDTATRATNALKCWVAKVTPPDPALDVTKLPYWIKPDPTYYFDRTETPGLPVESRLKVHAGLLEIHSQVLEQGCGTVEERIRFGGLTFDLFADVFAKAKVLTERAIEDNIPALTFDVFVCGRWSFQRLSQPVSTVETPIQFGHEWTSNWERDLFLARIQSRIVHWRAHLVRTTNHSTGATFSKRNLERAQCIKAAVARLGPDSDWKRKENLEALCLELDSEGVPAPKGWHKKLGHAWEDQLFARSDLVRKVIKYDLES